MNYIKILLVCIAAFLSILMNAQITIFNSDAEKYLSTSYSEICTGLFNRLQDKEFKNPPELKQINYDLGTKTISGKYLNLSAKSSESEALIDFNNSKDSLVFTFKFSGDFIDESWDNLMSLKIGFNKNLKSEKVPIILTELSLAKFNSIFNDQEKKLMLWVANHQNLYSNKISNSPCILNQKSFANYGSFLVFTINIRLRNYVWNNRIKLYSSPVFIYTKNSTEYLISENDIPMIWNETKEKISTYIDNSGASAIVIDADIENKHYCWSPVLAVYRSDQVLKACHSGYVLNEDFKKELSESEAYIVWQTYRLLAVAK